jgi:hypothetical protein
VFVPSSQVISAPKYEWILLPKAPAVFPINSDPVITIDPEILTMAPPACQKHNNKPIEAAVSELVRNAAFED